MSTLSIHEAVISWRTALQHAVKGPLKQRFNVISRLGIVRIWTVLNIINRVKRQLTRCVRVSARDSKTLSANEVSRQRFRSRHPISPVQSPFHCLEAVYSQIRGVPCIQYHLRRRRWFRLCFDSDRMMDPGRRGTVLAHEARSLVQQITCAEPLNLAKFPRPTEKGQHSSTSRPLVYNWTQQ